MPSIAVAASVHGSAPIITKTAATGTSLRAAGAVAQRHRSIARAVEPRSSVRVSTSMRGERSMRSTR